MIGKRITKFGSAQDSSNHVAVSSNIRDLEAALAMLSSPPPGVASKMQEHGVIAPIKLYIEA